MRKQQRQMGAGIKLHIDVDTLGLLHTLHITRAYTTDRDGAIEMIGLNLDLLFSIKSTLLMVDTLGKNLQVA